MKQKKTEVEVPLTARERFADWLNGVQFIVYTVLVILLLLLGVLWQRMFKFVMPGHLGVVYRTLYGGTVTNRTWGEGLHVIPPWDQMTVYEVRLQQRTLEFRVLSDEGLTLGVQVVVRYRPNEVMLGYLQKDIGPDYFDRLVRPEIESHIRRTFGGRPAHELYATVRDVLQEIGQFSMLGRFEKSGRGTDSNPYVYVQDLKLIIIELPKVVENAIVEKYHQEQLMLAYKYRLEREVKEAERKRTEATGIRDFNQIAGQNADILRWRSLEVASEYAKSPNSKFVIMGNGQSNPPLILNMGDGPSAAPTVPSPSTVPAPTLQTPRAEAKTPPGKKGDGDKDKPEPQQTKESPAASRNPLRDSSAGALIERYVPDARMPHFINPQRLTPGPVPAIPAGDGNHSVGATDHAEPIGATALPYRSAQR